MGCFDQTQERLSSADFTQVEIIAPHLGIFVLSPFEELQGADLSQGVIDVVEGGIEDVALLEPVSASFQEIIAGIVFVRQILLFQGSESRFALSRGPRRVGVDLVLEMNRSGPHKA